MKVFLEKITSKNINKIKQLKIKKEQEDYIESIDICLIEAQKNKFWEARAILKDEDIIGFTMFGYFQKENRVWLDRLLIDKKYQGYGYGKEAILLLIEEIKKIYNVSKIYLSVYDNNLKAIKLYKRLGFYFNGELDINGELVMEKEIK